MKNFFILFLILSLNLFAQSLSNKWVLVSEINGEKIFVDTTTIKHLENQITVLSFTFFEKPKSFPAISEKVASAKEQILFTLLNQKYSRIGTLYYDDKLKILGEFSTPGLNINTQTFAEPIDSNQAIKNIYNFCLNYINKKEQISLEEEAKIKNEKKREFLKSITEKNPAENVKKENPISSQEKKSGKDSTLKIVDARSSLDKKYSKPMSSSSDEWKLADDSKTIFTDGTKFAFQVSSWKNKAKAESEVRKLKAKGYNAFVVEANVPGKGGIWYRVRVGYFNSIDEAQSSQRKLK